MTVIRIAVPVLKGKRRFHLDKGRTWSVIEHLILTSLANSDTTAQALADKSKLPRRLVIEAIIRLMEAGWIELSQRTEGIVFRATELGKGVATREELPTNPKRVARWRSFVTDKVTGTVFRGRELAVFEKHVLEKRAQQERMVWIEPREIKPENHVKAIVATLFDDDERFVSMEQSGDRLVDRFAVITYRNDKVEGLPTRAPKELEKIIAAAAKTTIPRDTSLATYRPPPPAAEIGSSDLVARPMTFRNDDLILGSTQHQEIFDVIARNCRHELIVHSTFVTDERLDAVMPALTAAINRGATVNLLWGQGNEKGEVSKSKKVIDKLRQKISALALEDAFRVRAFSTRSHAKLIVADTGRPDRHIAVVGSCNWLSSNLQSFEASVRIREPFLVADVVDQLAELSLGEDGHWTELTSYLASLGSDIRSERPSGGPRASAHLVLGADHGVMVRRARDSARKRIFVTSHRLSAVGKPAIVLPAVAAAVANDELEAKLYFGIPSGEAGGTTAADVTRDAGLAGVSIRPVRESRLHAKLLAWDDDSIVVSSQNWLSADPSEENRRKEIGIFLNAPGVARHVIDVFEALRRS